MLTKIGVGLSSIRRRIKSPTITWELCLYLIIVAGAAILRFWELDLHPIHYDEGSFHTYLSWQLSMNPHAYHADPTGHGPVLYLLNAMVYAIFWPSDYISRVMPASFGCLLVFLPYFLRRELGRTGALTASLLLALSPTMLFISRFLRHDVYDLVFSFLLVICVWRYLAERRAKYIYIGAVVVALGFATMETFFFTVAIIGSFLFFLSIRELLSGIRHKFNFKQMSPRAELVILIGTLALPQMAALLGVFQKFLGVTLTNKSSAAGAIGEPLGSGVAVAMGVVCLLIVLTVVIGWRWNLKRWLLSAFLFYFVYAFFYTTFFFNLDGFGSGIWRSLGYWLVQHGENRLYQPTYYYIMMLSIYEFLPVLLAIGGLVYFAIKRSLFSTFLIYWFIISLLLFTWAGEKAPWLVVHITLPAILLGSKFIGEVLVKTIDIDSIRNALSSSRNGLDKIWAGLRALVNNKLPRTSASVVMVSVLVFLLAFSAHNSWRDNYRHSDKPVEVLDYAQVSYGVSNIMEQIQVLAHQTGKGKDLLISVDNDFWWPLATWYLKDYRIETYNGSGEPQGDVLLLALSHKSTANPYLGKYGEGESFQYLLWFPTTYQGVWPKSLGDDEGWKGWWDYLTSRKTNLNYWFSQGIAYFPK